MQKRQNSKQYIRGTFKNKFFAHNLHYYGLVVILSVLTIFVGCERHSAEWAQMDVAERLMGDRPDSALIVLNKINISQLGGKEEIARYALLKSMALDKNYVDITTFDVLQPAIDYYIENGTPNEIFLTYYYQGRIYQNQGDDDSAMRSFMNACDLKQQVTDYLMLAHTLVAQGTLYLKQYKTKEFINNNLEAARLYNVVGKDLLEIKSYANAIDGYITINNKSAADSILSLCMPLVRKNSDGEAYVFRAELSYTIEFCKPNEIRTFLDKYSEVDLSNDEIMSFARGYSKIGEYDKALNILSKVTLSESAMDSLKYASVKIEVLEKLGKFEQAFILYKDYSVMLERYQKELLSQDLLFSDKKHQLEMDSLLKIQDRDRIIWGALCGILGLTLLVGWLYYRGYISKTKRILAEKENESLRLERENLKLEISRLESERDNLQELQREQSELAKPIQDVIKIRLDILNGLLAKEITNNESYAEPYNKWIKTVRDDKKKFMDSTRLAFAASNPKFMEYLEQHGLSTDEINYLCLYAIGLRGKEVGEYIQLKRHYIISHEIRKKLGIDEHETNIGLYIRRLIEHLR